MQDITIESKTIFKIIHYGPSDSGHIFGGYFIDKDNAIEHGNTNYGVNHYHIDEEVKDIVYIKHITSNGQYYTLHILGDEVKNAYRRL